MMITVVDYGVGNLFSLTSSLRSLSADVAVSGDIDTVSRADKLILPGVGAFGDAVYKLKDSGLYDVIIDRARQGVPLLGICLGMQLLYERSFEFGEHEGLGLIKGDIIPLREDIDFSLKVPHIGWNRLTVSRRDGILRDIEDGDYVYFVHSYYAKVTDDTSAYTDYGTTITASVSLDNVYGCQFHPEKSGEVGLKILRAFCEMR